MTTHPGARGLAPLATALVFVGATGCTADNPDFGRYPPGADMAVTCNAAPTSCGLCRTDGDCVAMNPDKPRCDVAHGRGSGLGICVTCLPSPFDNCPFGSICQDTTGDGDWSCVMHCDRDSDCRPMGSGHACCGGECVDITSDVAHCGSCGVQCCTPAFGTPACSQGHCVVRGCRPGYSDCNGSCDDGCEKMTSSDPLNCGACGRVCPPTPHSLPTCSGGACATSCELGWADCDGNPANGCETGIDHDARNCGGCGKACDCGCSGGHCGMWCDAPGFTLCGGQCSGVCTRVSIDRDNCGSCGNACARDESCTLGRCQRVPVPSACDVEHDQRTGAAFVTCQASRTGAWFTATPFALRDLYDAGSICLDWGYAKADQWGSQCGPDQCGWCQNGAASCLAPGTAHFDGGGQIGSNADGPILQGAVQWHCSL